ncbi:MAG: transposase [Acetobacteraceae bacterium]|nr:transposase [Acetobacteraceae bacterium]
MSIEPIMDTSVSVRRRHKSRPEALKREIVAAATAPGASVSVVARRYDVNTNIVFTWRRRFAEKVIEAPGPQLLPVTVTPDRPAAAPPSAIDPDLIEIEHPRGYRVRIAGSVKAATCGWCWTRLTGDDCGPVKCAGLACRWAHGHAGGA